VKYFLGFFNENSKEQHLFKLEMFYGTIVSVSFDQFLMFWIKV